MALDRSGYRSLERKIPPQKTEVNTKRMGAFLSHLTFLVLDTDFLIRITNDPIRRLDLRQLSTEFTIATIPEVVKELQGLSHHRENKTARRASNALRVIEEKGSEVMIQILPEKRKQEAEADVTLVELARKAV